MVGRHERRRLSRRSSPRAEGYDYTTPGSYFFTIRTYDGVFLFGDINDGVVMRNAFGDTVDECWTGLPQHFPLVILDAFVVMPNHIHGIVMLNQAGLHSKPDYGLSQIVRVLKSFSTRRINDIRATPGAKIWQRSFYDHIIRDDRDLERVRGYIEANPGNWRYDSDNPMSDRAKVRRVSVTGEGT
jgi:REP element-mobilizing transposase RayT